MGELERRWSHVEAVARRADKVAALIFGHDDAESEVAVMAAWLHDVGYGEEVVRTGCHHLDGAYYVRHLGQRRLAGLVAHHSSGAAEAYRRGWDEEMATFDKESSPVADLLTYCDLSTGPGGTAVSLDRRLAEVTRRYGADHVVAAGLLACRPELEASFARVEAAVAGCRALRP